MTDKTTMTDQGKQMTVERLDEIKHHSSRLSSSGCRFAIDELLTDRAALEASATTAEELRDFTMKDRDEFRERAIAAEQRNATLEAENKTLRDERDAAMADEAKVAGDNYRDFRNMRRRAEAAEAALRGLVGFCECVAAAPALLRIGWETPQLVTAQALLGALPADEDAPL